MSILPIYPPLPKRETQPGLPRWRPQGKQGQMAPSSQHLQDPPDAKCWHNAGITDRTASSLKLKPGRWMRPSHPPLSRRMPVTRANAPNSPSTRGDERSQTRKQSMDHTLLILGILAAWLSSPGSLNVAQRPKHRFFSSKHRPEIKLCHKNYVLKNKVCGGSKHRPKTARLSLPREF